MESLQKACILQVGADQFEIAMDSVLRTFGSKIEMFLDTTSQPDTYTTKYVIKRPKDVTIAFIEFCYTGQLHIPQNVCKGEFFTELTFWGLSPRLLEKCCFHTLSAFLSDQKKLEEFESIYTTNVGRDAENGRHRTMKEHIWGIVNCDRMSIYSKVYFYVSTTFVLLVIAVLTINSMYDVNQPSQQNSSSQLGGNMSTQDSVPLTIIDPPADIDEGTKTPLDVDSASEDPAKKKYSMKIAIFCNHCSYFESGNAALFPSSRSIELKVENTDIHLHSPKCCKEHITKPVPIEMDTSADYNQYDGSSSVDISPIDIATPPDINITIIKTTDSNRTRQPRRSSSNLTSTLIAVKPLANITFGLSNISIFSADNITARFKVVNELIAAVQDTVSSTKEKFSSLWDLDNTSHFEHKLLYYLEHVTMVFFTIDFCIRLITCPNKKEFFNGILNWLDLILLIGSFARTLMELSIQVKDTLTLIHDFLLYVQIFRVFRLFRTIEQIKAFQVLSYSLATGLKDICVLAMYVLVSACIFSNLIYFVEKKSDFPSIPAAWWWSIITMTTVGYGDMAPKTVLGKLIGSLCALSGVMLFSLIIPVFVSTFLTVYEYANRSKDDENQMLLSRVGSSKLTNSNCNNESVRLTGKCRTSDSNIGTRCQERKSVNSVEEQCSLQCVNVRNSSGEKLDSDNIQEKPMFITTQF